MARAVVPRTAAAVDHADTELIWQSGHRVSLWCFLIVLLINQIRMMGFRPADFIIFDQPEGCTSG